MVPGDHQPLLPLDVEYEVEGLLPRDVEHAVEGLLPRDVEHAVEGLLPQDVEHAVKGLLPQMWSMWLKVCCCRMESSRSIVAQDVPRRCSVGFVSSERAGQYIVSCCCKKSLTAQVLCGRELYWRTAPCSKACQAGSAPLDGVVSEANAD